MMGTWLRICEITLSDYSPADSPLTHTHTHEPLPAMEGQRYKITAAAVVEVVCGRWWFVTRSMSV